jgi:hypothetical protein
MYIFDQLIDLLRFLYPLGCSRRTIQMARNIDYRRAPATVGYVSWSYAVSIGRFYQTFHESGERLLVIDYVDLASGIFTKWSRKSPEKAPNPPTRMRAV